MMRLVKLISQRWASISAEEWRAIQCEEEAADACSYLFGVRCEVSVAACIMSEEAEAQTRAKRLEVAEALTEVPAVEENLPEEILVKFERIFGSFKEWEELEDVTGAGVSLVGGLRLSTLNANGLRIPKLAAVLWFIVKNRIDMCAIQDARLSEKSARHLSKLVKQVLGPGTWTKNCSYVNEATTRRGCGIDNGGQFIIVGPRWGGAVVKCKEDWSKMGLLAKVVLKTGEGELMIVSTYWPHLLQGDVGSSCRMSDRCAQWLRKTGQQITPMEYMHEVIHKWWFKHMQKPGNWGIILGDMNAGYLAGDAGALPPISEWAGDIGARDVPWEMFSAANCGMRTRRGYAGARDSFIDHILISSSSARRCVGAWTDRSNEWKAVTDHEPLFIQLRVERGSCGIVRGGVPAKTVARAADLQTKRKDIVKAYKKELVEWSRAEANSAGAGERLLEGARASVEAVAKVQRFGKRPVVKDGWSPLIRAYGVHLGFLLEVRRRLLGQAGRAQWSDSVSASIGIKRLATRWSESVVNLNYLPAQMEKIVNLTNRGPWYWCTCSDRRELLQSLNEDIKKVKSQLHGRHRTTIRRQMGRLVQYREDMRVCGRIGYVIKSIMGTFKEVFDLSVIRNEKGDILTDGAEIHKAVTEFFKSWFAMPEEYRGRGIHDQRSSFAAVAADKDKFCDDLDHTGIPRWLRLLYWEAITYPKHPDLQKEMAEEMDRCPTLEEFMSTIKCLKKNSAPGMTGLSYNMIIAWPPEMAVKMYECLAAIWSNKEIPDWWKWRWLVPIPKTEMDIPEVEKLRPLTLVEPIRKLWLRIILGKITRLWKKYKFLSPSQHGALRGMGTDTASLQHINMMEQAVEDGDELFLSSWDMKRAFDALSKAVLRLGWERGGVPAVIAAWLVALDEGGVTVVRSPAAEAAFTAANSSLDHRVLENESDILGFDVERGTPQGEVISPLSYNSIADILARAQELLVDREIEVAGIRMKVVPLWLKGGMGQMYRALELMYIDDVISPASSVAFLQIKAMVVSAFCIIFAIMLSMEKMRHLVLGRTKDKKDIDITIYTYGWIPVKVAAPVAKVFKYLGTQYDSDYSSKADLEKAYLLILRATSVINATRATAESKNVVMQACVLKKISYPCKFGTLSRTDMKRLDSVLDSFYKKITRNMNSHPASLLHMTVEDFGLGLPSCFDLVQLEKWGYFCRGLKSSDETASATHALLERILSSNNIRTGDGVQLYLPYIKEGRKYVASSLVEWNVAQEATLCRGGASATGREESVLPYARQEMLRGLGYCTKGDFVTVAEIRGQRMARWAIPAAVLRFQKELLEWLGPVPKGAQKIARGQFWQCSNEVTCAARQRVEVVGWDREEEPSIYYVVWTTAEYKTGKRIRRPAGRADILISKYKDLFAGVVERVIVSMPMCRDGFLYRHVTATQEDLPPVFRSVMQKCEWRKKYERWVKVPAQIFVDGSWSEPARSLREILTESVPGVGAAAVVIMPNPCDRDGKPSEWWRNVQAIRIIDGAGAGLSSSYGMEFIANAVGCQLSASRDNRSVAGARRGGGQEGGAGRGDPSASDGVYRLSIGTEADRIV